MASGLQVKCVYAMFILRFDPADQLRKWIQFSSQMLGRDLAAFQSLEAAQPAALP